ncbi:MAG: DUF3592 domain-containing protein [Phycisphaerales bacterium]|nr:DUF3592 domain-containing protein [Phycisphaerales bacterium]
MTSEAPHPSNTSGGTSGSAAAPRQRRSWGKIVFVVLMIVLICGWWLVVFDRRSAVEEESANWPYVLGKMVSHGTAPHPTPKNGFKTLAGYFYVVNDLEYSGNRVEWTEPLVYPDSASATSMLHTNFPIEKSVKVYYDPKDPGRACLIPSPDDKPILMVMIGGGIFTVSVLICFGLVLLGGRGQGPDPAPSR